MLNIKLNIMNLSKNQILLLGIVEIVMALWLLTFGISFGFITLSIVFSILAIKNFVKYKKLTKSN